MGVGNHSLPRVRSLTAFGVRTFSGGSESNSVSTSCYHDKDETFFSKESETHMPCALFL
jgi:hypothetical protein